ncbi:hypothetical protein F5X99DRAFT_413773 [Biscogniauxia marginata]|nr:hypothetical protein F5X99DRAFT_413773 [Biscogniauxia marginata]
MALTSRIALRGPGTDDDEPEDFLNSSLGVIFPDDVTNQHGDANHSLVYTSPHLRGPLHIALAEPEGESDRRLFSHYLWNSSLLLAEFVEAGTLGLPLDGGGGGNGGGSSKGVGGNGADANPWDVSTFTIRSKSCLELGAGTALPSIMAALLGARSVVVTDYPSPAVLDTLRRNVAANGRPELSPLSLPEVRVCPVTIEGHAWGDLDSGFASRYRGGFDRVFVCDCLWMPWQHSNLHRSIAWFLRDDKHEGEAGEAGEVEGEEEKTENENENNKSAADVARAWVIAGFHTGRAKLRGFFDDGALRDVGLAVERIWERDCDGVERAWVEDRGAEDPNERKRWLVVAVLKRRSSSSNSEAEQSRIR